MSAMLINAWKRPPGLTRTHPECSWNRRWRCTLPTFMCWRWSSHGDSGFPWLPVSCSGFWPSSHLERTWFSHQLVQMLLLCSFTVCFPSRYTLKRSTTPRNAKKTTCNLRVEFKTLSECSKKQRSKIKIVSHSSLPGLILAWKTPMTGWHLNLGAACLFDHFSSNLLFNNILTSADIHRKHRQECTFMLTEHGWTWAVYEGVLGFKVLS